MSKVTPEEMEAALEEWRSKFDPIQEAFKGASVEDCIKILHEVEALANKNKEEGAGFMGFKTEKEL